MYFFSSKLHRERTSRQKLARNEYRSKPSPRGQTTAFRGCSFRALRHGRFTATAQCVGENVYQFILRGTSINMTVLTKHPLSISLTPGKHYDIVWIDSINVSMHPNIHAFTVTSRSSCTTTASSVTNKRLERENRMLFKANVDWKCILPHEAYIPIPPPIHAVIKWDNQTTAAATHLACSAMHVTLCRDIDKIFFFFAI